MKHYKDLNKDSGIQHMNTAIPAFSFSLKLEKYTNIKNPKLVHRT